MSRSLRRASSKTDDFLNVFYGFQKARNKGKNPQILFRELRWPFCGRGHPFREEKNYVSRTRYGVAHTPTKLTSHLRKRSCWLSVSKREESRQTPHNEKMRKPAHRSSQLGEPIVKRASAVSYFHPLNSSFIAVSNAVFILFSIIYKIKASIWACYFFLRFFSSSFWLI